MAGDPQIGALLLAMAEAQDDLARAAARQTILLYLEGLPDVDLNDVGCQDVRCGLLPLQWAFWMDDGGLVELFLKRGADPDRSNSEEVPALHDAYWCTRPHGLHANGLYALFDFMRVAKPTWPAAPFDWLKNTIHHHGNAALMVALLRARGSIRDAESMDFNADHYARFGAGDYPLHVAVRRCDVDVVEFLLGAGADPLRRTQDQKTALMLCHNPQVLSVLLKHMQRVPGHRDHKVLRKRLIAAMQEENVSLVRLLLTARPALSDMPACGLRAILYYLEYRFADPHNPRDADARLKDFCALIRHHVNPAVPYVPAPFTACLGMVDSEYHKVRRSFLEMSEAQQECELAVLLAYLRQLQRAVRVGWRYSELGGKLLPLLFAAAGLVARTVTETGGCEAFIETPSEDLTVFASADSASNSAAVTEWQAAREKAGENTLLLDPFLSAPDCLREIAKHYREVLSLDDEGLTQEQRARRYLFAYNPAAFFGEKNGRWDTSILGPREQPRFRFAPNGDLR